MVSPSSTSPSPAQTTDTLSISSLELDHGVLAPYVFGERKVQPATVSISLDLSQGFSSAATADALDQNTVHYGNLAKAVRDKRPKDQTLGDLVEWVERAVDGMAVRGDGTSRVRRSVVEVLLGKASMAGTGVRVASVREGSGETAERELKLRVEGLRVMVLIGVNAIERTAKQPLEVELEVTGRGNEVLKRDVEAFGLEREMIEIIEPTTFETLESLGEHVVKHLQSKVMEALPSAHAMNLTMRKPKAIAFAGAPALSLTRPLNGATDVVERSESAAGKLRLIKPYA